MNKKEITTKYTHIPESIREDMIKLRIKTRCNKDKNWFAFINDGDSLIEVSNYNNPLDAAIDCYYAYAGLRQAQ